MIKACTGGQVSPLNGEEYKGGQFMPEHGDFCGLGKNRIAAARLVAVNAQLTNARIIWNGSVFQIVRKVTFTNGQTADQVQFSAASIKTLEKLA
jgi:hypothetical protein